MSALLLQVWPMRPFTCRVCGQIREGAINARVCPPPSECHREWKRRNEGKRKAQNRKDYLRRKARA